MAERTGAEMFAEMFTDYGVSHVFFVPTILNHSLYQMEKKNTPIQRIMTHGEKSAAYMADGYARASGRPGICMAQTVGAANLAAGLRDGSMACSPIIAITGGPYKHSRDRHQYQEVNDFPVFQPVTKWSTRIDDVAMIPWGIRQAFRAATTNRPGPVFIEMEGHQGESLERVTADVDTSVEERFAQTPPFRPGPERDDVVAAAWLLAGAAKPILVVGGGARTSGAGPEILELAERLSIPVVTSINGKAVVPGDHPLNAGVVGLYSREAANRAVSEADLVFFIGSKTGSQVTHSWRLPAPGVPVVHCDLSGEVIGLNYPQTTPLVGDAKRSLRALLDELVSHEPADRSAWIDRIGEIKRSWYGDWQSLLESDVTPMRPERLCKELTDNLPSDALLVSDTGHAGMWTAGMIDLNQPDQDYIRAAGSLGWAFPAALGAQCAVPGRPVVAFTGDGGFWYHIAEIETAVRWDINATIVVNNNNSLNQEIGLWTDAYEGRLHGRHHEMWHFNEVSLAEVSRHMGAESFRVEKPSELPGALDAAVSSNKVSVVEVVTEISATAPKAYAP